jgi:tripartite-type tricarboxylate transporter receptor subunit TctC
LVARIVGQRLGERLRQPVLVDNRAGASGTIGMEAAAHAAPDGYTILFGTTNEVINPILRKLNVDPLTDLTAVSQLATITFVLLANPDFPPRTVPEVLAAARAKPGAVSCGWGAAVLQLACELLKIQGQVDINVVPYKGAAPAMNDLVGGQINLAFNSTYTSLSQVKANRVVAIATINPKRGTGPFGHLPTVGETLPGFEFASWFGVLVPSATPREIVTRLNREIAAVLEEDDVRKRLTDGGLEVTHGSPEAFAEIMRRDHLKFSRIIRDAGIKPE